MNIQSQAYNYFPKIAHPGLAQNLHRQKGLSFPGTRLFWSMVGKVFMAIVPVTLIINLWFGAMIGSLEMKVIEEKKTFLQVDIENVSLRAEKAQLFSPQYMVAVAADKLSLNVPATGQIKRM